MTEIKKKRKPLGYNKRSEEEREVDVLFCSDLFLKGYSYREISAKLNEELLRREANYTISFQMVYYDLQQSLIEWKRERLDNIDQYITQELKKLDKMETELWSAWEKSKGKRIKDKNRNFKVSGQGDEQGKRYGDYGYSETATEDMSGNPRFLDLLLDVMQRRAKLLGYDAPVKVEVQDNRPGSSNDDDSFDASAIPDELLFSVVNKMQDAKFRSDKLEVSE